MGRFAKAPGLYDCLFTGPGAVDVGNTEAAAIESPQPPTAKLLYFQKAGLLSVVQRVDRQMTTERAWRTRKA